MIRLFPAFLALALCLGVFLLLAGCAQPVKRSFWAEFIEDMENTHAVGHRSP